MKSFVTPLISETQSPHGYVKGEVEAEVANSPRHVARVRDGTPVGVAVVPVGVGELEGESESAAAGVSEDDFAFLVSKVVHNPIVRAEMRMTRARMSS